MNVTQASGIHIYNDKCVRCCYQSITTIVLPIFEDLHGANRTRWDVDCILQTIGVCVLGHEPHQGFGEFQLLAFGAV